MADEEILISIKRKAREDWDNAFSSLTQSEEKLLIEDDSENLFDKEEWEW